MSDPFSDLAERYLPTIETLRGVVRHTLVARQLGEHLPKPPARIVDIGGGAGHQAIPLAREGYALSSTLPAPCSRRPAGPLPRRKKPCGGGCA